ncbi:peptidase S28 [Macrolepiota fuliginosa MF-IS2]|uniref:Peptidase S28 n=1 Tax=Macrolepiota fuliginosa MF-IS2 TaxID=1400762 RepID=A0A9P6C4T2_9AGAR|nr:peptidase S28 [Macrolepiota fuliginosa MF-IS2]
MALPPAIVVFLLLLPLVGLVDAVSNGYRVLDPQAVNIWRLQRLVEEYQIGRHFWDANLVAQTNNDPGMLPVVVEERWGDLKLGWFEQPLDHFDASNPHRFQQRYWVNTRHYSPREGAPIIILDGGAMDAMETLSILDTGIADILARETGGISVLLEHRYYGASIPVANFTTDSLRWLTNEQAMADSTKFMSTIRFEKFEENLTALNTPWIYYGGSYAGARAAHMKVLHPELVYGAIGSSAITHATLENWQFHDVIRRSAEPRCAGYLEKATEVIDNILDGGIGKRRFKGLFGLSDLKHDDDFVSLITFPLAHWESKGWIDSAEADSFEQYCAQLVMPYGNMSKDEVNALPFGHPGRLVDVGGDLFLDFSIVNWANYIKHHPILKACLEFVGDIDECFTTYNDKKYQNTDLSETDRPWRFQMCTQWGTFIIAPPDFGRPRIISRAINLEYKMRMCQQSFSPGEHYQIPIIPNITKINLLGGYDIAADRLAFIDGEIDPWRPLTPHSSNAKTRSDTILRPFKVIPGAVHLWDLPGLPDITDEPLEVRKIHNEIVHFVKEWLKYWEPVKK